MTRARRITGNFFSLVLSDLFVKILGVFSTGYLARCIGPDSFGLLNVCLVIANYFVLAATWSLPSIGIREISAHPHTAWAWNSHIARIRIVLGLGSYALLALWTVFYHTSTTQQIIVLAYGLTIFTTIFLIEWVYQALEKLWVVGLERVLVAAINMGGILFLVREQSDYVRVPWILLASTLVGGLVLYGGFRSHRTAPHSPSLPAPKTLLAEAFPIGLSAFFSTLLLNADTLLLGAWRTAAEVGLYSGAYRIVMVVTGIFAALSNSLFPALAYYSRHDQEKLATLLRYTSRLAGIFLFPISIAAFFVAEPLMRLFYGASFSAGSPALTLLLLSLWANCLNSLYFFLLISNHKQRDVLKILGFQVALNLVLNAFAIPYAGIVGAALATLLSDVAGFLAYRRVSHITIPFWRPLFKVLPACLLMAGALAWGRTQYLSAFWLIPGGMFVFSIGLWIFRGVTVKDLAYGLALLKRKDTPPLETPPHANA